MPAATNRTDLLNVTKNEFAKLTRILDTVSEDTAKTAPEGEVSVLDIVLHRAHWAQLFLGWVRDGRAGQDVQIPDKGYKWNQLKVYNAALRQRYAGIGWIDARERLVTAHSDLMAFITAETDDALYTQHLHPWMNDWTIGRWAEASGASHYRSASKYIRKVMKAQAA